ncbi:MULTISPECIES: metallophosphoesterase family protein [unclassified Marinimicrobium]|jgi:DNA repair exonuclease SbcCD nuclease subunit|uniref:metallophosphoesterase family protein n=1 Tax=Marinimicrobium TaxID=359337 RepID=UPI000C374BB0|nr:MULTISPECIES: DNA repair exonuclease [unclassified Marinimicrobium]MAN50792.1 DNA repair exonuclease [Marinimicrobium sp.]
MPRFLHTADWQIGRQYSRFAEEDASILADARFTAIETLAALATEQAVDAVLVAGDVFDAQNLSDRTIHRTFQAMAGFTGPWLLLPGNHDAALAESVWTHAQRLSAVPDNVDLLLTPEVRVYQDLGFAVLPAPLTQRQTYNDLTEWFDRADTPDGLPRIGLAHGSVEGQLAEEIDSTNPIAADRAATARLDYLALGDWHGYKTIDARTRYSGTPEQERFKDNGAGQALIVDIEQPGAEPQVQPHTTGQFQWIKHQGTLAVASDLDRLIAELDALPPRSVVDLTVDGEVDLSGHQTLLHYLGGAEARHRSFQSHLSGLNLIPTEEDIAALHADGYVGEVIGELRERQEGQGEEADTARTALAILAGMLRENGTTSESEQVESAQ